MDPIQWQLQNTKGAGPFVTWRHYRNDNQETLIWRSRQHRKNLSFVAMDIKKILKKGFSLKSWKKVTLNGWIGIIFAIGSSCFLTASVVSLIPAVATMGAIVHTAINTLFFIGSIPFTTAAYLQLFQAANAAPFNPNHLPLSRPSKRRIWLGWRPQNLGWLSCALQFPGTILFNFNTFDALWQGMTATEQLLGVWIPDFVGSILFLASGYLAFMETCHGYWDWEPKNLDWWITFTNLIGCVGFMVSALFSYAPQSPTWVQLSLLFTALGALGFLLGSLLMVLEAMYSQITTTVASVLNP